MPTLRTTDVKKFNHGKDKKSRGLFGPCDVEPASPGRKSFNVFESLPTTARLNTYGMTTQKTIEDDGLPKVGCMPNCSKGCYRCNFEQDFSMNYTDPIEKRPGYFKEFNTELEFKKTNFREGNKQVKIENTGFNYDICEFGKKGTPINLETSTRVMDSFKDKNFYVKYKKINPSK